MSHLKNIDSLSYVDLPNVETLRYSLLLFKSHLLLSPPISLEVFKCWGAAQITVVEKSFPKF